MHIRALPVPDRRTLYQTWHSVYIYLARMAGALRFIAEGYVLRRKVKETGSSVSSIKSMAGSRGEKMRGKVEKGSKLNAKTIKSYATVAILFLALAGAVYFLLQRLG
jgi:hypothetical protein